MQDKEIIRLFFRREQSGIAKLQERYGAALFGVARGILGNRQDAEECVNDALLKCWDTIPPQEPDSLFAYASKIVRNNALLRLRSDNAKKRRCTGAVCLEELAEALPDTRGVSDAVEAAELASLINAFLRSCGQDERDVFILRYYGCMSVSDIAKKYGFTQSRVKMTLKRCRDRLARYLERNGYGI
ncbi:MAG: sigma-70 family RNA polymerase sigma factor [Clostridia bacterium]|nr:sigma-70 family RNA polymerase sigma factor [Clostridia bacterium]